jgi:hypothetical protein
MLGVPLRGFSTGFGDIDRLIDTQLSKVRARLASMRALEKQLSALKGRCGRHALLVSAAFFTS